MDFLDEIKNKLKDDRLAGAYLAKPTGRVLEEDKTFIEIEFSGETRYAKPCFPFGTVNVPTEDWLEANNETIGVWIIFEHGDPSYPIWLGVAPLDNKIVLSDYPNIASFKTVEFERLYNDSLKEFSLTNKDNSFFKLNKNSLSLRYENKQEFTVSDKTTLGDPEEAKTEAVRNKELVEVLESLIDMVLDMQTISPVGNNSTGRLDPLTLQKSEQLKQKIKTIKSKSVEID